MAHNLIQFQHGMSLPEFIQCFGAEAACVDALQRARWSVLRNSSSRHRHR